MPASEAQIRANRANSSKSTGPVSLVGKEKSRANSLKHGLTGAGVVLPEEDAAEIERLTDALRVEMKPPGVVGEVLIRQLATASVRGQRSFVQETAALSRHVRQVMDEFEAPEGVDDETAEKLRVEAGKIALFDPSREACLARRYEAAANRTFFRSLKELRQLKEDEAADPAAAEAAAASAEGRKAIDQLASFCPERFPPSAGSPTPPPARSTPSSKPSKGPSTVWDPFAGDAFDVPMTIGRRR